jgi:radical SAM superfamily enzyme YgiQ (UPF0313 family)
MKKNLKRIYLISPKNPDTFWTMQSSVDAVGAKGLMPNAALATLVSLTPGDLDIEYVYCDENISKINWNTQCDLAAVTGYTIHSKRIKEISEEFRKRNIPVAIGGPFATLHREAAKNLADFHFISEAEYTWPQFLEEWVNGKAKPEYIQKEHIDMKDSPAPDWSFIKGKDYLYFTVQTSRGCPNNCDFCDAIQLVGRKYRTKTVEQVMTEIRNAYNKGAETIFFSEDNFFVNKAYTKRLLTEIIKFNTDLPTPVSFSAQATIKIGNDEEILKMLADARFSVIFLGVESIRKKCLDEINKGHIYQFNPVEAVSKISSYGIIPFVGLIVGFDNDDSSTFGELRDFLNSTASPIASISILNAPENTVLYQRMEKAGRINENFKGLWHFSTNIVQKSMPFQELIKNHRDLFIDLYKPENFEERALNWMKNIKYFSDLYKDSKTNYSKSLKFFYIMKYYLLYEPADVRKMFFRLIKKSWKIKPRLVKKAITLLSQYCHYYNFANNASWQKIEEE